jgi:hypothetical protein
MKKLQEILSNLRQETQEIEALAVVSVEGLMVASDVPRDVSKEAIAGMSALLLSAGHRVARELAHGQLSHVYVGGAKGGSMIVKANEQALLLAMIRPTSNLDAVLSKMNHAKEAIARII